MTIRKDKMVDLLSEDGNRVYCSHLDGWLELTRKCKCTVYLGQAQRDGKSICEVQWQVGYPNCCTVDIVMKWKHLRTARWTVQVLNDQSLSSVSKCEFCKDIDWIEFEREPYASWVKMTDSTVIGIGVHFELPEPEQAVELLQWLLPYWIYSARLVSEFAKNKKSNESKLDVWEQGRHGVFEPVWRLACRSTGLTLRQTEVLAWLEDGKTNKEVAVILGCTPETIKAHVREISSRLGTSGRNEAIRRFREALYVVATGSAFHSESRLQKEG